MSTVTTFANSADKRNRARAPLSAESKGERNFRQSDNIEPNWRQTKHLSSLDQSSFFF